MLIDSYPNMDMDSISGVYVLKAPIWHDQPPIMECQTRSSVCSSFGTTDFSLEAPSSLQRHKSIPIKCEGRMDTFRSLNQFSEGIPLRLTVAFVSKFCFGGLWTSKRDYVLKRRNRWRNVSIDSSSTLEGPLKQWDLYR